MFSIALIVFREFFEIFLILGIIFKYIPDFEGKFKKILIGAGIGGLGSIILAYFAGDLDSAFGGIGQELTNAIILLAAAILIASTVVWMNKNAFKTKNEIAKLSNDLQSGRKSVNALVITVALLILREGSEIALFITSYLSVKDYSNIEVIISFIIGMTSAVLVSFILYKGIFTIMQKYIFKLTNFLMCIVSANMISESVTYFSAAGLIPESNVIWNLHGKNEIVNALSSSIGFFANPTLIELGLFIFTLLILAYIIKQPKTKT